MIDKAKLQALEEERQEYLKLEFEGREELIPVLEKELEDINKKVRQGDTLPLMEARRYFSLYRDLGYHPMFKEGLSQYGRATTELAKGTEGVFSNLGEAFREGIPLFKERFEGGLSELRKFLSK